MPASYRIDEQEHIVYSRAWGTLTDADIVTNRNDLFRDPAFSPDLAQLYDFSGVTELALSTSTVRRLAGSSRFAATARRAIVVSTDVAFGMARMYALLSERSEDSFRIFRSTAAADRWLKDRSGLSTIE
jgi:hypothetical protein